MSSDRATPSPLPVRDPREIVRLRRIRLIERVSLMAAAVGTLILLTTIQAGSAPGTVLMTLTVTGSVGTWALAHRGRPDVASRLLLVLVWILSAAGTWITGGLGTASFLWPLLCPLIGGLLIGRRGALVGTILAAATLAALVVTRHTGLGPAVGFWGTDLLVQNLADAVGASVVAGLTVWLFLNERRWAEQRMVEAIESLEDEVRERTAAERAAREAEEAKTRFLGVISHELRTPLNGVLGVAQLLGQQELNGSQRALLRDLERCGEHLLAEVEKILEFTAEEEASITATPSEVLNLFDTAAPETKPGQSESGEAPREPKSLGHPLSGRALVVEDDDVSRLVASKMLVALGLEVAEVGDGPEALETMGRERYDVVLLDGNLPTLDGCSVARRLRDQGDTTPIVAVTASAMPGDRERFLAAGMDAYIAKPVRLEELAAVLKSLLASAAGSA